MKILLVQPPIEDFYETAIRLQPIGLAYLKAAVRKWVPDMVVKVLDFHNGYGRRTLPLPRELRYLRKFYEHADQGPFSTFYHYYRFGADSEEILAVLRRETPDLIGISSLFSPYYREALEIATLAKRAGIRHVLMGGSHVSAEPEMMLAYPDVDFIIRGEGERPFVELLRALTSGSDLSTVPNLGFKAGGHMTFNPIAPNFDLADLPIPDLSDFQAHDYLFEKKPLTFLVTSRSCPHHCSFCSVHQTFGHSFRRQPVERVWEEIVSRYEQGYRVFDFEDDNLTFYQEEMKTLCDRIIDHFGEQKIELLAMNGISYLSLTPSLLEDMRRAGFTHLNLSLVTSDRTVLQTTKRPHTVEKYLQVIAHAFSLGFQIVSYQILGLPFESPESMMQTFLFQARLPVLMGSSMFYLTPNSPIAKQLGHLATPEDCFTARSTAIAHGKGRIQRDAIYTLFVATRVMNLLKSLPIGSSEWSDIRDWLQGGPLLSLLNRKQALGLELLRQYFATGLLFAETHKGRLPLRRLDYPLLRHVFSSVGQIRTQEGGWLEIHGEAAYS